MARIKVQKLLISDTTSVTFFNKHSFHGINTLDTWTWSRMSPSTRILLGKAVASGMEWKDLKRITRADVERVGYMGKEDEELRGQTEVPKILRITNLDFNNFRKKFLTRSAQLHTDCRQILYEYAEMMTQAGGISRLQNVQEDRITDLETFFFAFSSNWQVEVLLKYNSLLFLDATHNTCISLEDRQRKAFLYTLLVKLDTAGCGAPVAFVITNSETQWPLARWLNWLREKYLMPLSPKVIIDCTATEMAAIERSFENPQILLCHWHMLRALQKQANSKIKISGSIEEQSSIQIKRSAVQDFLDLMHTETIKEFGQVWMDYFNKYRQHEKWLRYLIENWLKHPEKWWSGNRAVRSCSHQVIQVFIQHKIQGMLEINTNNYIESWHNTLKSEYIGGSRKQRTDILVYLLLREVLPDIRLKIARVTIGLERRRLSNAEKAQRKKCIEFSCETASYLVRHSVVESGDDEYSEVILVKSFTNHDLEYVFSLNPASAISYCSWAYITESKSVFKHIFLAHVVFGYSISYDTRLSENSNLCGKTPLVSNAEPSTS